MTAGVAIADMSPMDDWTPVVVVCGVVAVGWLVSRPLVRSWLAARAAEMLGEPDDRLRWAWLPVSAPAELQCPLVEDRGPAYPVCQACLTQRVPADHLLCGVCLAELDRDVERLERGELR